MSGNNHGYYYAPTNGSYPVKHWSEWTAEQQQYYVRGSVYDAAGMSSQTNHTSASISPRVPYYGYTPTLPPPPPPPPLPPPSPNGRAYMPHRYQETSNDRYSSSRRMPEENRYQDSSSDRYSSSRRMTDDSRYPTPNSLYPSNQPGSSSWNRSSNYKRSRTDSEDGPEPKAKSTKKKKKPLSQNTCRKDWKKEEAEMALACEKEYNKRHRNQSLIIKFPDLELNKDIVSKFHGAIENVHFQQPSTARFCFVTLEEGADADTVISDLKKVKFGSGYLTAEYKKDREEDQNIGPDDIDPYTLYVGNLAQEITKQDIMKTFPKCKRIDIGYAKKMKYTRYAFVTFKTIAESIEAFKKTHSTQMYSKSLIVRFRRLHGTVGMPGESKPQNPPRKDTPAPEEAAPQPPTPASVEADARPAAPVDLNLVKQEPASGDEEDVKPDRSTSSRAGTHTPDTDVEYEERHRPMKLEIKDEFKTSPPGSPVNDDVVFKEDPASGPVKVEPKEEPRYMDSDDEDSDETPYTGPQDNSFSSDDDDYENRSFSNFYESLVAKSRSIPAAAHKSAP